MDAAQMMRRPALVAGLLIAISAVGAYGAGFIGLHSGGGAGGPPPPPPTTITDIQLSANTFQGGAGSANSTIGTLSVFMNSGSFTGTLSTSNANFTVSGNTLKVAGADLAAGNYTVPIIASQGGISNSPFTKSFTIAGASLHLITNITLSNAAFTGGTGSAGATVGTVAGILSSGAFTGAITTDNVSFTVVGNTLKVAGADLPPGNYSMNLIATQAGISNSPFSKPFTITAVASGGLPTVTLSSYAPLAGGAVTVTYNPGGTAPSASDFLTWNYAPPRYVGYLGPVIGAAPTGPGSTSWTVPTEPSEYSVQYVVDYWVTLPTPMGTCNNAVPAQCIVAESAPATIPPTIASPGPPSGTPPANVSSNPPGWPSSPARTLTVCASGCDYTVPSDAVLNAEIVGTDYTLVTIATGTYLDCFYHFTDVKGPQHLWIKGVNGNFAHIKSGPGCSGQLMQFNIAQAVIDNLELSDWQNSNVAAVNDTGCTTILLRNVYIHDGGNGMLTGQSGCTYNITILNSHFSRLGDADGPSHGIYIGEPTTADNHLTITNSIFEMVAYGQLVKSRAFFNNFTCNKFLAAYAPTHNGSLSLDFGGGGGQSTVTNNLIAKGPYFNGVNNNQFMIEFGLDKSGWHGDQPTQFLVMNNNIVINDLIGALDDISHGQVGSFIALGAVMTPPSALPYTWSNNKFIGPLGFWPQFFDALTSPIVAYSSAFNGDPANVNLDGTNQLPATRAAAGLPSITPTAFYYSPYDNAVFPQPAACTERIGNVTIP